jgi:hypothetical protein
MSNSPGQSGDLVNNDKTNEPSPQKSQPPNTPSPRARRRWLRWTLLGGTGTLVLLAAGGPTLAGILAPSLAPGFIPVNGKVTVDSASFGWFSGQSLGTTTLFDDKGKEVAHFKASTDSGLLSLLFGGLNFGKVKVEGAATIVRAADGTTNLQRLAVAPTAAPASPAKSTKPPAVPKGLALQFEGSFDITYTDEANPQRSAKLKALTITADAATGKPLKATVKGKAEPATGAPGDLNATIALDSWSDADGTLQLDADKARGDLSIEIANFPSGLLDAFSSSKVSLREVLGDTVGLTVKAKGGLQQADGSIVFASANANTKADLAIKEGRLTISTPEPFKMAGRAFAALSPQAAALLKPAADAQASLAAFPDVTVNIASLSVPLPKDGVLDLRGTVASITAATTAMKGTITTPGQPPAAFDVAAMTASIKSDDLAKAITIKAATQATFDGKPAGVIDIDLVTGSVLDASGAPIKSIPAGLAGKANITGFATAIAQPFLKNTPLNLAKDIGPTLDVRLTAKDLSTPSTASGAFPPAELELVAISEHLKANGRFAFEPGMIRTLGEGFTADADSAAAILKTVLGDKVPVTLSPNGRATITAKGLSIPLRKDNSPDLAQAAGTISITSNNWAVAPANGQNPMAIRSLVSTATLAPGKPLTIASRGTMAEDGREFTLTADATVPGLFTSDPAKPIDTGALLRTLATVEFKDLPTSLARFAPTQPAKDAANPPLNGTDFAALANDAVGPTVTLKLATTQAADKGLTLAASVAADRLSGAVAGTLLPTSVSLTTINARSTLTPEAQRSILTRLKMNAADLPELVAPATLSLAVQPITIPMKDGLVPDLTAARGDLVATLSASEQVLVRIAPKPGQPALGTVGVRNLAADATLPLQVALGAPGMRGNLKAALTGTAVRVQQGATTDVGVISAGAEGEISDSKLAGTMNVTAVVKDLATVFLDELAGKPGYATGALGDTATLDTRIALTPPTSGDLAASTIRAEMGIKSPRLNTTTPIKVSVLPDRISVTEPATLNWSIDPVFANLVLKPQSPAAPGEAASIRVTQPTSLAVTIRKASFSKSVAPNDGVGPMLPGIFDLAAGITSPGLSFTAKDGTTTKLTNFAATTEQTDKGLAFNITVAEAQAGTAAPVTNVALPGLLSDFVDAKGNFNAETARVTAVGDLPAIPTILLDTLAAKDGLLVEALGPVTTVKIDAKRFGKQGGSLAATATSARASFDLAGTVENALFVNTPTQPMKVGITEITQALSARVVKGLPLFGKVEKSAKDRPAMVTGTNLKVPLTNDLSKFDGDFQIDPGEVTFEIAGDFADIVAGPILAATKGNAAGKAGQKLAPMTVNVKAGIARLQRWPVPVGEFTVQMDGTMNLITGEVDFVTYFPAGALALEKLKLPGGALGSIAGDVLKSAVIPVRTKGIGTARKTEVDSEAAAKELLKGVDPSKLIEKGLKDLFGPKK